MNAHRMDFGGAVAGDNIATEAVATTAVVLGQQADPMEIAESLGRAVEAGKVVPMNMLAATKTAIPGGRDPNEIDPALKEGREGHTPVDWTEQKPGLI